jgi:hypothetical protein
VELPDPTLITDPVTDQVDETQGYASELVPPNTGRPLPYTLLTPGDTDLNPDGSTGVETDPVTGDDNSLVPLGAAADGVAVTLPFQLDNPCAGGSPDPCDPKPGSWDPVDVGAIVANPKGLPSAIAGPLLLQGKAIATSAGYVCAFTPQKTHRKFIGGGGDEVRGEIKNPCYGDTSHISSVSLFAQVQYYHHTLHRDHVTAHWRNAGNSNTSNWYGAYNHATVYASSLCSGTHTWRVTGHGDVYLKAGAVPNHLHQSGSGPSHVITCN